MERGSEMETKTTVERIWKVGGFSGQPTEPVSTGKWISWDQQGSKGVMESRIKRLKDAGIAAYYNVGDRSWGVLAEQIEEV
jgi:hypothetical protein